MKSISVGMISTNKPRSSAQQYTVRGMGKRGEWRGGDTFGKVEHSLICVNSEGEEGREEGSEGEREGEREGE